MKLKTIDGQARLAGIIIFILLVSLAAYKVKADTVYAYHNLSACKADTTIYYASTHSAQYLNENEYLAAIDSNDYYRLSSDPSSCYKYPANLKEIIELQQIGTMIVTLSPTG